MEGIELPFRGKSMLPLFRDGDVLFFIKEKKWTKGDIVVLRQNGQSVAHRVVAKNRSKGDRSGCIESIEDILGMVIGFRRGDKRYFWGRNGQPLKRIIAFCSKRSTFSVFRFQRYFFQFLILCLIALSLQLSKKSHS